jgi:hypothetical protein
MFSLKSSATFLTESRRRFLHAGFLGVGGLSLADLLQLEARARAVPF